MDRKEILYEDVNQIYLAGCCKHGNEPAGSKKKWVFLGQLSKYQLPEHDCAVQNQVSSAD